jgi:hypothetical protein
MVSIWHIWKLFQVLSQPAHSTELHKLQFTVQPVAEQIISFGRYARSFQESVSASVGWRNITVQSGQAGLNPDHPLSGTHMDILFLAVN